MTPAEVALAIPMVPTAAVTGLLAAIHAAGPDTDCGRLAGALLAAGVNEYSLRGAAVALRESTPALSGGAL